MFRPFLIASLGCLAFFLFVAQPGEVLAAKSRPNVIVVYTDDQGSVDMGCYGTKDLLTPHVDAIARNGVRFTQMYAPAPVCSPSRAGLMTGRYPVNAGVSGNVSSTKRGHGMPADQVTMAEVLKGAGYATAHIGKWHLGYSPPTMPNGQGFDYSFGHMGGCIDNYSHFFYWAGPNRHDLWRQGKEVYEDGAYFPALMVKEADQFIGKQKDKPFFIYFALNVPHYPYQGHANWLKYYNDKKVPYPRNLYNAFVTTQDHYIGELMSVLKKHGVDQNTIVVVQSDHGHSVEGRAHYGGGNAGKFRGHKFTMFEGGLRVPTVVSWPKGFPKGVVRDQIAHGCDWLPTFAELCGAKVPVKLDGRSLVKVLKADAASPHDVLHWQLGNGGGARWAVRHGPWKLIGNAVASKDGPALKGSDRKLFLANLDTDVSESKNLAGKHPDQVKRLKALHDAWVAGLKR